MSLVLSFHFSKSRLNSLAGFFHRRLPAVLVVILSLISLVAFIHYFHNGLGLSYNDARSHLDIGRRVVEGLKPGLAQLGSVWLPLPHLLMIGTIWNDFMWHSGLSGSLISMVSFVASSLLVYKYLAALGVKPFGRLVAVAVFVVNLNTLYLQSTAMTELLLIFTMTAASYFLLLWFKQDRLFDLVICAFFVMLSTLVRYDGWFLLLSCLALIFFRTLKSRGYKTAEGTLLMFGTLAGLGVVLWLLWNQLIFKDALYFAFGPFSARAQQAQLESAGVLATKGNLLFSLKIYLYALAFNSGAMTAVIGFLAAIHFWLNRHHTALEKFASLALFAPLAFNVLALYFGHSVLFVQGLSGNSVFNIRYGIMLLPTIAIFWGYLVDKLVPLRSLLLGLWALVTFFSFVNHDAVTIDDAKIGASQKNVSEVSGWLTEHALESPGYILISVASHDAIVFSSHLPMKRFIHEGTGTYWESATAAPDRWARWIIMRTHDTNDLTWKLASVSPGFTKYQRVGAYPFADIYELKPEFLPQLPTSK